MEMTVNCFGEVSKANASIKTKANQSTVNLACKFDQLKC